MEAHQSPGPAVVARFEQAQRSARFESRLIGGITVLLVAAVLVLLFVR